MTPRRSSASPDVVVIGGGIIGVSAAAHLLETGRRVVVVERDRIAAGASGRNSGVVQHPFDPVLVEQHLETVRLYRRLEDLTAGRFALPRDPAGLLLVSPDEDALRASAAHLGTIHPGLAPTFLSPAVARRVEPSLADGIAACRLEIGYPVGPARATQAYADHAASLGAEFRIGVAARPWVKDGHTRGVILSDGSTMGADAVVVAAGPWSPDLVDPTGRWRPVHPRWGVVVEIALEAPPQHVLEEAEIDIEPSGTSHADSAEGDFAFSLITADGSTSLGSTFLAEEPDAASLVARIIERGSRFVPAIADAAIGAHRVCARPQSADGRPLVGAVPGRPGLWIAAGHGPWGISTGPASGRLVAGLIDGHPPSGPAALDPARFGSPFS